MGHNTELHHMISVAIGGIHTLPSGAINGANLIELSVPEHKKVHDILHTPYQKLREFRMKHEFSQYKSVEYYTDLHKIQNDHFLKINLLPKRLISLHARSIEAQVSLLADLLNYNGNLHLSAEFFDDTESFKFYLAIYHKIFLDRAEKFEKKMGKK